MGLLAAFELLQDRENNIQFAPEKKIAPNFVEECFKRKLIVRPVTYGGRNVIAMSPPLVITKTEIEQMISIFSDAVRVIETTC